MIFHTPVTTLSREQVGEDSFGNPIYEDVESTIRGELRPLQGDEKAEGNRETVTTRFRLFMPPSASLRALDGISIFGEEFELVGEPEPHTINGRLHHKEVLVQRVTG